MKRSFLNKDLQKQIEFIIEYKVNIAESKNVICSVDGEL